MTTTREKSRGMCRLVPICALARILAIVGSVCVGAGVGGAPGSNQPREHSKTVPIRGLHLSAPAKKDLATALDFIRESLPQEQVNTLILEFDYDFDFRSRPEFGNRSALSRDEVRQIVKACRAKGIQLIPQINCLGHQSWAEHTGPLLAKHPEFDETRGKYPDNKGIYCRSYCPLHPEIHLVLFSLIDELASACEAKAFHVGLDEVFILGDPDCPRCQGKQPAELFAGEVLTLRDHLKKIGCRMWMWGDRFIDGKATGIGKWEASENGTESAVDHVPKDIVICDWHYDKAPETPQFLATKGFEVVACPWRKPAVALAELAQIHALRGSTKPATARPGLGVVQTTWCGFASFAKACRAQQSGAAPEPNAASESARCFLTLFRALREKQL